MTDTTMNTARTGSHPEDADSFATGAAHPSDDPAGRHAAAENYGRHALPVFNEHHGAHEAPGQPGDESGSGRPDGRALLDHGRANGSTPQLAADGANRSGAQKQSGANQPVHKWWTLVGVCLGTFMLLIDVTIVNVALPDIQVALSSSFSALQWIIDAYALTLAALLLTAGSLADLFGRRKLYLIGLVVFIGASALCGAAQNTLMLQVSRGVQGIGGAIMFSVSLALLANAFRGKDRGTAFAIWGAITGLAVALGPLLGGLLTSGLNWRFIFFINVPIGLVAIGIVLVRIGESRGQQARRPDWLGFVVFTVALCGLVFGLIESNGRSFGDVIVLGPLLAAVVLLVVFVLVEHRSEHAMFDLSLFAKPTFSGGSIAAFGLSATLFSVLLYVTLYLQNVLQLTPLQTGVRLIVLSAAILLTSSAAGRLASHIPIRLLIGPGLLLVAVGLFLMRGLTATSTWTHLIPGLIVAGIGSGLVNPPLAQTAVGVVKPRNSGMASGINSTFRQVGIATGIAVLGTLFGSRVSDSVRGAVAADPQLAQVGPRIATSLQSGKIGELIGTLPPQQREQVGTLAKTAFTSGLNHILLISAVVAAVAAVASFFLIRTKDFVSQGEDRSEKPGAAGHDERSDGSAQPDQRQQQSGQSQAGQPQPANA